VTRSPPLELSGLLYESSSFHNWDSNAKVYEYGYFLEYFSDDERSQFPIFTTDQLFQTFTFENWFSANVVLRIVAAKENPSFLRYIRWLAITVGLRGFTTTRTVKELLFGYEDEYLAKIKSDNPSFGGDPSAPSVIAFNDLNLTKE
jgi:hypothetical protein